MRGSHCIFFLDGEDLMCYRQLDISKGRRLKLTSEIAGTPEMPAEIFLKIHHRRLLENGVRFYPSFLNAGSIQKTEEVVSRLKNKHKQTNQATV